MFAMTDNTVGENQDGFKTLNVPPREFAALTVEAFREVNARADKAEARADKAEARADGHESSLAAWRLPFIAKGKETAREEGVIQSPR